MNPWKQIKAGSGCKYLNFVAQRFLYVSAINCKIFQTMLFISMQLMSSQRIWLRTSYVEALEVAASVFRFESWVDGIRHPCWTCSFKLAQMWQCLTPLLQAGRSKDSFENLWIQDDVLLVVFVSFLELAIGWVTERVGFLAVIINDVEFGTVLNVSTAVHTTEPGPGNSIPKTCLPPNLFTFPWAWTMPQTPG